MGTDTLPEAVEHEVDTLPSIELNQGKLDALIQFSQQTEKIGKALDRIRTFVLGRALPGDFVRFGDRIEMTGPAAERILSSLGLMGVPISFTGWTYKKDTGIDKLGDYYNWWYEANVEIGGLRLGMIQGRAGSRDKFFGKEGGEWKDLSEVKESDIRMAARRGVFKEAIKVSLGLRGIPVESAGSLGLDPTKIKTVEFGKKGESKVTAAAAGTPVVIVEIKRFKGTSKPKDGKPGKDYVRYTVIDDKGAEYSTFDKNIGEISAEKFKSFKTSVLITYKTTKFGNEIESIVEAPKTEAETVGDAQE